MKHPYLCACLTLALSFTVYQPGVRLDAAELWNSSGNSSSSAPSYYVNNTKEGHNKSGVYYNVPGNSTVVGGTALYNVKDSARRSRRAGDRVLAAIDSYNNVRIGKQRKSRQYKYMSADAVANRQSDIERALQLEYKRRKKTARRMIEVQRQDEAARIRGEREHQRHILALKVEKESEALERQRRKDRALGRIGGAHASSRVSSSRGVEYTVHSSSSTGMKKPARLFNNPND